MFRKIAVNTADFVTVIFILTLLEYFSIWLFFVSFQYFADVSIMISLFALEPTPETTTTGHLTLGINLIFLLERAD